MPDAATPEDKEKAATAAAEVVQNSLKAALKNIKDENVAASAPIWEQTVEFFARALMLVPDEVWTPRRAFVKMAQASCGLQHVYPQVVIRAI